MANVNPLKILGPKLKKDSGYLVIDIAGIESNWLEPGMKTITWTISVTPTLGESNSLREAIDACREEVSYYLKLKRLFQYLAAVYPEVEIIDEGPDDGDWGISFEIPKSHQIFKSLKNKFPKKV